LNETGPFMVFAPTDKAFKKFAANKPDYFKYYNDHPELVKLLLTNHVIPKILKIDDLKNNELLEPLSKQYLRSNIYGTASSKIFTLNGVIIPTIPSFQASNGVIYTIDDLLMCTAYDTIQETLTELYSDKYSYIVKGLKMTRLLDDLKKDGPITLFAFTDKAFDDLPNDKKMALISNAEKLKSFLRGYIVHGAYYKNGLSTGTLKSIDNSAIQIVADGTTMTVNGANIIDSDILAGNGVIHVIDKLNFT